MPLCSNCGSQQPDGAAFCDECGAKLGEVVPLAAAPSQPTPTVVAATCPVCGVPVTPGEAFCDNCGAALGPTPSAPPPQAAAPLPPPPAAAPPPGGALICSNCGTELEPGSHFCDMCGTPVSAPAPPPSPPIPTPAPPSIPTPTPPPIPTPPPAYPPVAGIQGRLVVEGTNITLPFPPGRTEIIVGREDPVSNVFPEIDLTDHGGDEGGVSRRHARIFLQGDQVFIEDLNSTNYTYVNQQKLTPEQPHPLNDGDEIRFGRMKLRFHAA